MSKINDLFNRLSDYEKRIVIQHLNLTDLDSIEISKGVYRGRLNYSLFKSSDDFDLEKAFQILSDYESKYLLLSKKLNILDEELFNYKFWNVKGKIETGPFQVRGKYKTFGSRRSGEPDNFSFCGNVRDLILELNKLYNDESVIPGALSWNGTQDGVRLHTNNCQNINRIIRIAECLDTLRIFLEVHPELKGSLNRLPHIHFSSEVVDNFGKGNGYAETIVANVEPLNSIKLDETDFKGHEVSDLEIMAIKRKGSYSDKMNTLLGIIETHYLMYKSFYESKRFVSEEEMFKVVVADVIEHLTDFPILNPQNKIALQMIFGDSVNIRDFVSDGMIKVLNGEIPYVQDVQKSNSITEKIADMQQEMNWDKFVNNANYERATIIEFLAALVSKGSEVRIDNVNSLFGVSNIISSSNASFTSDNAQVTAPSWMEELLENMRKDEIPPKIVSFEGTVESSGSPITPVVDATKNSAEKIDKKSKQSFWGKI